MIRPIAAAVTLLFTTTLFAAGVTRLVPVFAESVPGAEGSRWQSELRFYNGSREPQPVRVERIFAGTAECTGFPPFTIAPGALAQMRSIGCGSGGAAAIEITADETVELTSVITNTGGIDQDACCLAGFTQNVPVLPVSSAYTLARTVANLQVPVVGYKNIGRHNLIFVNPNDEPLPITLHYYGADGTPDDPPPFPNSAVTVPSHSYLQLKDVLPQLQLPFEPVIINGYWRIGATADRPFYFFDSYVDNATNDATSIESH